MINCLDLCSQLIWFHSVHRRPTMAKQWQLINVMV